MAVAASTAMTAIDILHDMTNEINDYQIDYRDVVIGIMMGCHYVINEYNNKFTNTPVTVSDLDTLLTIFKDALEGVDK